MSQEYVCERCGYKVTRQVFDSEDGRHEQWWACTNPALTHYYGLPHRAKDWEFNALRAQDPGLDPWPEKNPLQLTVSYQQRRASAKDIRRWTAEAIPAIAIAFSLLMGILVPLSSPVHRVNPIAPRASVGVVCTA